MGFLSASTSVVRFVATAPSRIEREAIAQAVTRHAFRESDPEMGDPRQAWGWIAIHDPLLTTFTPADLFFHHYLVLGFRYDKRLVPPKLLMLERRRLEREREAARGVRVRSARPSAARSRTRSRRAWSRGPCRRRDSSTWCGTSRPDASTSAASSAPHARRSPTASARTFGVTPVPLIPYLAAEHVGLSDGG